MQIVVPFPNFAAFMNDKTFWSNWTIQMSPQDDEIYFIKSWAAARGESLTPTTFDFSKTNVTLLSKQENINWEMDGEHIGKFFIKWTNGERL